MFSQYVVGVAAVTIDSALSGFATIYFEKVLKTTALTVWDRNLQLAFWSTLIYIPWALIDHIANPFFGWSWGGLAERTTLPIWCHVVYVSRKASWVLKMNPLV